MSVEIKLNLSGPPLDQAALRKFSAAIIKMCQQASWISPVASSYLKERFRDKSPENFDAMTDAGYKLNLITGEYERNS